MDHKLLENSPLFKDVAPEEIDAMLQCLGTEEKEYEKGEIIFHAGDVIHSIGLVLTGRVQIENDDLWGNKSVSGKRGARLCLCGKLCLSSRRTPYGLGDCS